MLGKMFTLNSTTFYANFTRFDCPAPGPLGGHLCRGPLFTGSGAGPFRSRKYLEGWFDERLLVCQQFHRVPQTQPSFSGRFENSVMCHMDIAARNVVVDRQRRVWVLDWAYAGGYPVYFEEAVLRRTGDPDFTEGLLRMVGEEHTEDVEMSLAVGFALTTAADTKPVGHSKLSILNQYIKNSLLSRCTLKEISSSISTPYIREILSYVPLPKSIGEPF